MSHLASDAYDCQSESLWLSFPGHPKEERVVRVRSRPLGASRGTARIRREMCGFAPPASLLCGDEIPGDPKEERVSAAKFPAIRRKRGLLELEAGP